MLRIERDGLITLPPPRNGSTNGRHRPRFTPASNPQDPVCGPVGGPVEGLPRPEESSRASLTLHQQPREEEKVDRERQAVPRLGRSSERLVATRTRKPAAQESSGTEPEGGTRQGGRRAHRLGRVYQTVEKVDSASKRPIRPSSTRRRRSRTFTSRCSIESGCRSSRGAGRVVRRQLGRTLRNRHCLTIIPKALW